MTKKKAIKKKKETQTRKKDDHRKQSVKRKVKKRTSRNGSFFAFVKGVFFSFKKTIRKEQRRCLRHKRYQGKYSFCLIWALLNKYAKVTLAFVLVFAVVGGIFFQDIFRQLYVEEFQGNKAQTSLIGDLTNKINDLTAKIDDRKKCTEDRYWKPAVKDVCNYYLYQQENKHCSKFKVPTTRIAIGEKMCCTAGKKGIYAKNANKLQACPGSDIFFNRSKMHSTSVVASKDFCNMGVCEFYPANGFHAKVDETGSVILDDDGNIIIEKDCKVTQSVTPCNKACGGGERYRTVQTSNCLKIKTAELCNPEPCSMETN